MNNNVLKIIAGLLALGAVVVALIGVRLSGKPSAPTAVSAPAPAPAVNVVVAAKDVPLGHVLTADDLTVQALPTAPAGAYNQIQQVQGHVTAKAIAKGTPILQATIAPESLAALLQPGERAVAVLVDEVVGLGGHGKPGDHVDVLQFASASKESQDTTFAQILIRDARILTFGDATQLDTPPSTSGDKAQAEAMSQTGAKTAVESRERRLNLRSAVLAIPEADTPALMLAANTGQLRLALRPQASEPAASAGRLPARVADLSPVKAKPPASADGPPPVIIQEGSKERRLAQTSNASQP